MMIIRRNLCCRVLTLAGLLICSFLFCRPALAESQRLGSRWALIIDTDSGNPEASAELARTLRVSFGFSPERVIVLLDAEATEPAIQSAMSSLGERIAPSDTLFVHLSSRIVQQEEGVYLFPSGSDLKSPWTWLQMRDFFGWLHHLPTEATLITYPWCPPTSRKFSYQDLLFEELLYQKRPGPLEFLEVCDFSVARTVRGKGHVQEPGVGVFPEEESAPSRRRAFTVALASLLHKYGKGRRTLTGEQIARQLREFSGRFCPQYPKGRPCTRSLRFHSITLGDRGFSRALHRGGEPGGQGGCALLAGPNRKGAASPPNRDDWFS